MNLDDFIKRLLDAAQKDEATVWYEVVSDDAIEFAENHFAFKLPELLKRCYTEISNGGFGPGYQLTGLPGGHESSWGDLFQTTSELQRHEDYEDGWLPIIDWGCAKFSIVDCLGRDMIVTLYEGDFHKEDYTPESLMNRWMEGDLPAR